MGGVIVVYLYDLAMSYKNQFLDNYYILETESTKIIIYSKPFNFLHLTGLQRCPSVAQYDNKSDFYFDCIDNKFSTVKSLIHSMNKDQQNMILIKTCYFYNLGQSILQSRYLYKNNKDAYTCSAFLTRNNSRYQTFMCTYNNKFNCYMPKSNQVDIDEQHSCVINLYKEKIVSSECVSLYSEKGKEIFEMYIKHNKVTTKGLSQ